MIRIGIVGIGFMGMKRRRILRSLQKTSDFREIRNPTGHSLCLGFITNTKNGTRNFAEIVGEHAQRPDTIEEVGNPILRLDSQERAALN